MRLRHPFVRSGRTLPPIDILLSTKKRRAAIAAGSALLLTAALGVASSAAAGPSAVSSSPASASGLPAYDHIVVVMEENKYYDEIAGSSDAPYVNSLMKQGASFSNFHGTTHPSQGNYVALFSGALHGVDSDDCPYSITADNLGNQLLTSGHTAGIGGFSTGNGDLLDLVNLYTQRVPHNVLAAYLPALRAVNGGSSHQGLDSGFTSAWQTAASDPAFQQAQNDEMDRLFFTPAVAQAKADGLHALGQFAYFDAMVANGSGTGPVDFSAIRAAAMKQARTPVQGGDEATYINAFLNARKAAMLTGAAHADTADTRNTGDTGDISRIDTEQRVFLAKGNLDLNAPLTWQADGDPYSIAD